MKNVPLLGSFSVQTWLRLAVALVVLAVPVLLFAELVDEVRERDTEQFDVAVLQSLNSISSPLLDTVAITLTQVGGFIGVTVLTIGLAVILWRRKMRSRATLLVVGVGGAALLNLLLKAAFQRDRPELWERLVVENSYSFPSGHAMASSALAFSLIVVFWPTRWRWLVLSLMTVYTLVIGLTRLYLGVHYPTDIVAGWIVSAAWIATVVAVISLRKRHKTT